MLSLLHPSFFSTTTSKTSAVTLSVIIDAHNHLSRLLPLKTVCFPAFSDNGFVRSSVI